LNQFIPLVVMKNSKLAGLLTILACLLTVLAALFTLAGPGLFGEHLLVGAAALAAWQRWPLKPRTQQSGVVASYLISIVLLVVLNALRLYSDYPAFMRGAYPALFTGSIALNHTSWFLLYVCAPVSLLLLGGYFLSRFTTLGSFFAGWGFAYGIVESLIQFKVEFSSSPTYPHHYFGGLLVAMALFYAAVTGLLRLSTAEGSAQKPISTRKQLTHKEVNLWTALLVALVVLYSTALYTEAGLLPVGVIAGSMMGGLIGWRKTTARYPADPYQVVPLYLLLQALFYFHVGEEVLTGFNRQIAAISRVPWSDQDFTFFIAFLGPIVWFYAAYSLWARQTFGNFILWFLIVGMILGEPTHLLVFPVARMVQQGVGYEYFSGMYTALFPMIPAILALVVIIKSHRERLSADHAQ
jgi:hypothetical protein